MSQAPDGEPIQPEDEEQVALQVSRQRKDKARTSSKASIAKAQPLKVAAKPQAEREGRQQQRTFRQAWRRTAGELSEEEQRRAVEQALEVFRQLPASSSYAQHRIRVLQKALELLDKGASDRSAEEQDELQQLLSQLKI